MRVALEAAGGRCRGQAKEKKGLKEQESSEKLLVESEEEEEEEEQDELPLRRDKPAFSRAVAPTPVGGAHPVSKHPGHSCSIPVAARAAAGLVMLKF